MSEPASAAPSAAPSSSSGPTTTPQSTGSTPASAVSSSDPTSFARHGASERQSSQSEPNRQPIPGVDGAKEPLEPRELQKFKLRDGDEEFEVDESELARLKRDAQRARAANKRFEEAARMRAQNEQLLTMLQTDPMALLSHPALKIPPEKVQEAAERLLLSRIEEQMLTPEQKALRDERRELEALRKERDGRAEQEQKAQFEAEKVQHAKNYERQFIDALEKASVPKTPQTVKRMAQYLQQAIKSGAAYDMHDISEMVREDFESESKALYGSLEGDALLARLGPDVTEKIRKAQLAKLQGAPGATPFSSQQSAPPRSERAPERLNEHDWKEMIRRRAGF